MICVTEIVTSAQSDCSQGFYAWAEASLHQVLFTLSEQDALLSKKGVFICLLHLGLLMYGKEGPAQRIQTKPTLWGKKRALSTLIQGQCILGFFLAWDGLKVWTCTGKSDHRSVGYFWRTLTWASFTKTGIIRIISNHLVHHICCSDYRLK